MAAVILTPEQSRSARRSLGLTQAEVIAQGKVSGYKLKQFESGFADPEGISTFLRQLRAFYEESGVSFSTSQVAPGSRARRTQSDPEADPAELPAGTRVTIPQREAMFLCPDLADDEKDSIYNQLEANRDELRRIAATATKSGLFDPFDEETDKLLARGLDLLKEQGVLYGMLFGQCSFEIPSPKLIAAPAKAKTVGEALSMSTAKLFDKAGLLKSKPSKSPPALRAESGQESESEAVAGDPGDTGSNPDPASPAKFPWLRD